MLINILNKYNIYKMNQTNIIIVFLILIILIYFYNDFITPYIKSKLFKNDINDTNDTNDTNDANDTKQIEKFSQYSSLTSQTPNKNLYNNTTQFDNNWYLRSEGKNKSFDMPIISTNNMSLPVIRYGFYDNGAYEYFVGEYFRHNIYPITIEKLNSNLDTIYKFINNDIDIAFINEELLTRYIKKDCKYLTNLIVNDLGLQNYDTTIQSNIDRLYPPINFSAIGIGFHQDFYLIVNNYSTINNFIDIKNKKIGILNDSYYYFTKLCVAYDINNTQDTTQSTAGTTQPAGTTYTVLEQELEDLISKFKSDTYDGIFIVSHPKNKQLLDLSLKIKLRFIHIQKKDNINSRNNLSQITELKYKDTKQTQTIENITTSFNTIIKKYFQYITPRSIDLNKFHKSGNMYSYLDTYTTRMILVIRDDIPKERVKYITQNYISNLEKMRDTIDRITFQEQINNFSSLEFNYNELISFDSKIPISIGSKDIYVNEGLITYTENLQIKI